MDGPTDTQLLVYLVYAMRISMIFTYKEIERASDLENISPTLRYLLKNHQISYLKLQEDDSDNLPGYHGTKLFLSLIKIDPTVWFVKTSK